MGPSLTYARLTKLFVFVVVPNAVIALWCLIPLSDDEGTERFTVILYAYFLLYALGGLVYTMALLTSQFPHLFSWRRHFGGCIALALLGVGVLHASGHYRTEESLSVTMSTMAMSITFVFFPLLAFRHFRRTDVLRHSFLAFLKNTPSGFQVAVNSLLYVLLVLTYLACEGISRQFKDAKDDQSVQALVLAGYVAYFWVAREVMFRLAMSVVVEVSDTTGALDSFAVADEPAVVTQITTWDYFDFSMHMFYYVFYRSLFTHIGSIAFFAFALGLHLVVELAQYPMRMTKRYYRFTRGVRGILGQLLFPLSTLRPRGAPSGSGSGADGGGSEQLLREEVASPARTEKAEIHESALLLSKSYLFRQVAQCASCVIYMITTSATRFGPAHNNYPSVTEPTLDAHDYSRLMWFVTIMLVWEVVCTFCVRHLFCVIHGGLHAWYGLRVFDQWKTTWTFVLAAIHIGSDGVVGQLSY